MYPRTTLHGTCSIPKNNNYYRVHPPIKIIVKEKIGWKSLIEGHSQDYALLREAVNELSEEELRFKPAPDKWSIHQIVIHVTDSEVLSTHRLRKVLAEEEPTASTII